MNSFKNRSIDDRDSSLVYQGFWYNQGSWKDRNGDSGTLSSSEYEFANVTFNFPENARAFYYYAIPRCCGGRYQICVDCYLDNPAFEDIDGVNPTDDGQNPPIVMYSKVFDEPGFHSVILRNAADERFQGHSQITLDRFEIEVVDPNPPQLSTSSSTSSTGEAEQTSTTSDSSSLSSSSPRSSILGPAIGGAVGGTVLIALVLFLLFCFSRRRKQQRRQVQLGMRDARPYIVTANLPPSISQSQTASDGTTTFGYGSGTATRAKPPSNLTSPTDTHTGSALASPNIVVPPMMSVSNSSTSGTIRQPRREVDAGRIYEDDIEDEHTLPPEYHDVFRHRASAAGTHPGERAGRTSATMDEHPEVPGSSGAEFPSGSSVLSPRRRKFEL